MKTTFSLRRLAIIMIVAAITFAIFNTTIVMWLTRDLQKLQSHSDVLNLAKDHAHEVQYHVTQTQQFLTDVAATNDRGGFQDAEAHFKKAQSLLDELKILQPESKAVFDETNTKLQAFHTAGIEMAEIYLAQGQKMGNIKMKQPNTGFDDRAESLVQAMSGFVVPLEKLSHDNTVKMDEKTKELPILISLINVFSAIAFIATIVYLGRRLFRQLGGEPALAQQVANTIANGDLSTDIEVKTDDNTSLFASMYKMQMNLSSLIWQIKSSADFIQNGAREISAGNTNLSQRTEEQASSLEETASSMEEMASTVKQNAENAKQANLMATEASNTAIKGGVAVGQVVNTMSEINASSKKIVEIISVIDGIAFQTNILALNAAVEAARAGEQGRGFAVVAAEVRSLAQRSATAAKEIKQLIGDSVDKVSIGTKQVQAAGETMDEIVMAVKLVSDIVNEITAASMEQSAGIDQVNNAITNMDEVTQQNAALVEQAAAAASSLESKAHELTEATSAFRLAEDSTRYISDNDDDDASKLNKLSESLASKLPKTKQSRLKAPKPKEEDWEEF
jgi:methyl-accepting chemotaxis protein